MASFRSTMLSRSDWTVALCLPRQHVPDPKDSPTPGSPWAEGPSLQCFGRIKRKPRGHRFIERCVLVDSGAAIRRSSIQLFPEAALFQAHGFAGNHCAKQISPLNLHEASVQTGFPARVYWPRWWWMCCSCSSRHATSLLALSKQLPRS